MAHNRHSIDVPGEWVIEGYGLHGYNPEAMALTAKVVYPPHIMKGEGYCGGKATIGHTGVRVNNVVFLHKRGKGAEEIVVEYPDLTLGQVHLALAYYYDHPEEIEAEIAEDEGAEERHERRKAEALAKRRDP